MIQKISNSQDRKVRKSNPISKIDKMIRVASAPSKNYFATIQSNSSGMPELKYIRVDLRAVLTAVTSATNPYGLSTLVDQGSDFNQRIGRSITIRGLHLDAFLQGGQVGGIADDAFNLLRLSVITMAKGFTLAQALNTVYDKRSNDGLQHVYWDQSLCMTSPGKDTTGYMPAIEHVKFDLPLNIRQDYTGVNGNTFSGTYLAFACTSDSGVAPSPGFINGTLIMSYLDN